jgi:hypothetical protein
MNRYVMIHRLRGPAVLLLIGVLALLHEWGVISYFWGLFWPLLLILIGVIMLAERAVLAAEGYPLYPGMPYQGATYQGTETNPVDTPAAGQNSMAAESAIVPKRHPGFENDVDGGKQ